MFGRSWCEVDLVAESFELTDEWLGCSPSRKNCTLAAWPGRPGGAPSGGKARSRASDRPRHLTQGRPTRTWSITMAINCGANE